MEFKITPKGKFYSKLDMTKMITDDQAKKLGQDVVREMKDMISKGISPIQSVGRFPEYKAVTTSRQQKGAAKSLRDSARDAEGKAQAKGLQASAREMGSKAAETLRKGYPANVQHKHPDKRARPVNLYLTGEQMKALSFSLVKRKSGTIPAINYLTEEALLKEQGHREGVGGQPKRPTIPQGTEAPAVRLKLMIESAFNKFVTDFMKRAKK